MHPLGSSQVERQGKVSGHPGSIPLPTLQRTAFGGLVDFLLNMDIIGAIGVVNCLKTFNNLRMIGGQM